MKRFLRWLKYYWMAVILITGGFVLCLFSGIIKCLDIAENVYMVVGIMFIEFLCPVAGVIVGILINRARIMKIDFWSLIKKKNIKCAFNFHKIKQQFSKSDYQPEIVHITTYCDRCGIMIKLSQMYCKNLDKVESEG